MNAPRVYKAEAVVLRQRRLGEADKILTLFTAERGKMDAVAKGVRKPTSRKSGHVEPLMHVSLLVAHGRNLDIVTQAETLDSFLPLREDPRRLSAGLYVAELIDRYTIDQVESPPLFRLLVDTLGRLAVVPDLDLALRFFELNLLAQAGYQPELRGCVLCSTPLQPVPNWFSPTAGGAVCPACTPAHSGLRPLSVNALKVLRLLLDGRFAEAARLRLSHDLLTEIEGHLRVTVRLHAERDLHSLRYLQSTRRDQPEPLPSLT